MGFGVAWFNGAPDKLTDSRVFEGLSPTGCELVVGGTFVGLGAAWFDGSFCESWLGIAVEPIPVCLVSWGFG